MARFPWDPKPEAQAPPVQPAQQQTQAQAPQPVPAATAQQFSPQLPQPTSGTPGAAAQNGVKPEPDDSGVAIKQEGGQTAMPPPVNFNGMDGKNSIAASRAAQLVQKQYGERAVGSITAIQNGQQAGGVQPPQQQPQGGQGQQQSPEALQQAYRQQMAAAAAQQTSGAANAPSHLDKSQTDGAGDDFEGVLFQRTNAGDMRELGRVEIDKLLHEQIAAKAKAMEGGGLMLPLKEATRHKTAGSLDRKGKGVAGYDGGDDEDEVDEDAINSDLDDPDEDRSEDEVDDEGLGHIMLCMYDKVQRVKNKW